jgi:hypothetical protein
MTTQGRSRVPAGLKAAGRRLWEEVTARFELEEHEARLLVEAARTVDVLELLDAAVRRDGPLVEGPQGERAHPGAVEARQQRIALARLLAALRLPDETDQRHGRGAPRGPYSLGPASRRMA